ncbi:DUF418 domain-containing protein [Tenggerimyces flavus]|uniref:DUF418 domain-containing protein n=1 Tax=Tenggerimyces flavus TaxID=1708749 RepID=A0ABV7YG53_9ACTN|nr:DUF418 domain-containing protein [Tenggerimyces flavus]MBM7787146.1 putative membrane protein YeiB [Tenggerimyces flavus]
MTAVTAPAPGPTRLGERVLAPDLARGFMLLCIALANSHYFLQGGPTLGGFPRGLTGVDGVVAGVLSSAVDGRSYPMFATLFGYGVAHIYARQQAAGREWKPTRKLLRRRSLWMIAIGLLHGLLLYVGDIIAAYGILAFLLVPVLRWKDRWVAGLAALFFVVLAVPYGDSGSLAISSADKVDTTMVPETIVSQLVDRALALPLVVPWEPVALAFPFLVGILAARHRVLDEPARHLTLLRWMAVVGIAVGLLGGLPTGLMVSGVIAQPADATLNLFGTLHDSTGYFGGFGYAAAIALLAVRLSARRGVVTQAIAAVGQRSMTCYLSQSVVWTVVFAGYALDLSGTLSVTAVAGIALATWLATVVIADLMRRRDRRGPFEVLLRRLTYQR